MWKLYWIFSIFCVFSQIMDAKGGEVTVQPNGVAAEPVTTTTTFGKPKVAGKKCSLCITSEKCSKETAAEACWDLKPSDAEVPLMEALKNAIGTNDVVGCIQVSKGGAVVLKACTIISSACTRLTSEYECKECIIKDDQETCTPIRAILPQGAQGAGSATTTVKPAASNNAVYRYTLPTHSI